MAVIQTQPILLTKDKRPSSCFKDQIYDPARDGTYSDAEDVPYLIPAAGALVIDRNDKNALYVVTYVDPTTYASTLQPVRIIVDGDTSEDDVKTILYSTDKFTLYVNKDHKPAQLTIGSNFVLFARELTRYQLYRLDEDGNRIVVSVYLDSNEDYAGTYAPLMPIASGSAIRTATNCHTYHDLVDGETIFLDAFDNTGVLRLTARLLVRNEVAINDLLTPDDHIVRFDAEALQQLADGRWFLYPLQSVDHLGIQAKLYYHDGRYRDVAIDNKTTFIYGLENYHPAYPGYKSKVILKHYLGIHETASPDLQEGSGYTKYVTCEKTLVVIPNESLSAVKLSAMPVYNKLTVSYDLKWIGYTDTRDTVLDLTNYVRYTTAPTSTPSGYGAVQRCTVEVDLNKVFSTELQVVHSQTVYFRFRPYNEYERYVISDYIGMAPCYGADATAVDHVRRPVFLYDATLQKYYVPVSRFRNSKAFIEAFYTLASPPVLLNEVEAPTPTHFTVRRLDTLSTVIQTPIPISSYNTAWGLIPDIRQDLFVGYNCLCEFLLEDNNTYKILYGVPVDCYSGGDYMGEQQPLEG